MSEVSIWWHRFIFQSEPWHLKTNKMSALREGSIQPGHPLRPIRLFAVCSVGYRRSNSSRHTTLKQRKINVDATSIRCCYDAMLLLGDFFMGTAKEVSMIRKYHKLQTNPWHCEEEPHSNHEAPVRQTEQRNQLSLPHQDDCKTRMDTKERQQNRTITESHNGSNNQQRINNNSTMALERTTGAGGLSAFYWSQTFALDSAVVEEHKMSSSHGGFLAIAMNHHGETI